MLKNLYDTYRVSRSVVFRKDTRGRDTFAYFIMSDAEREAGRREGKRKDEGKSNSAWKSTPPMKPRAESKGIATLAPAKRHATHALEVGPATVSISISTSNGVSYSLSLPDAKFIYTQLHGVFGGVR